MKKLVAIVLACVLAFTVSVANNKDKITTNLHFSNIQLKEAGYYLQILVDNCQLLHTSEGGQPMLPYYTKTYKFPIGTEISNVHIEVSDIEELELDKKIIPSNPAVSLNTMSFICDSVEGEQYETDTYFPNEWYTYHIGVGIYNSQRTIFLNLRFYPVSYNAIQNKALFAKNFDVFSYSRGEFK